MNNVFFPKKGMVFFLEEPHKNQWFDNDTCYRKNRPYLVVSSDSVNEYSMCVQIVPITTKPPKSGGRWWAVPLKRSDGTCQWVNILNCICVPKTLCTVANRSESFAKDTENNSEFLKRVDDAIMQYFGIVPTVPNEPTTVTDNQSQPNIQISSDTQSITVPITLSITLDVNTIMSQIQPTQSSTDVTLPQTPTDVVEEVTEVAEVKEEKVEKPKKRTRPVFTKEQKNHIYEVISRCKEFGGDLTRKEVAEKLGVSQSTVFRYIKSLADGRFANISMTDFENNTLLTHIQRSSVESAYKYWKHKGFTSLEQFIEYCKYIEKR